MWGQRWFNLSWSYIVVTVLLSWVSAVCSRAQIWRAAMLLQTEDPAKDRPHSCGLWMRVQRFCLIRKIGSISHSLFLAHIPCFPSPAAVFVLSVSLSVSQSYVNMEEGFRRRSVSCSLVSETLFLSPFLHILCVYLCVKRVREPRKSDVANFFSSRTVAKLCVGFPNHKPLFPTRKMQNCWFCHIVQPSELRQCHCVVQVAFQLFQLSNILVWIVWYSNILVWIVWYSNILVWIVWYSNILVWIVWYSNILVWIVWYSNIPDWLIWLIDLFYFFNCYLIFLFCARLIIAFWWE